MGVSDVGPLAMVSVDLNVQPWLRALCLGPKHVGCPLYFGAWCSIFLQKGHQGKLLSLPVLLPPGECETATGAVKEHRNLVAPWLASVICVLALGTLQSVASSWLSAAPFRRSKG